MGRFEELPGDATHYRDSDDDVLEICGWKNGVVLNSGPHGVFVPTKDLIPLFERMARLVALKGTFIPKSKEEVRTSWGRTACGTGDTEVSISNGTPVETLLQTVANLLSIVDTFNEEAAWKKGMEKAAAEADRKAHDELRTSEIALEALELYKKRDATFVAYDSWDAVNYGTGASDVTVKRWIEQAERKREMSQQPQVGDLVRVSAEAKTVDGYPVHFGRSVIGEVVRVHGNGDRAIRTKDPEASVTLQVTAPKFLTIIAPAAEVEALRGSALLGAREYEDLTLEQQHLVDEIIAMRQEKNE